MVKVFYVMFMFLPDKKVPGFLLLVDNCVCYFHAVIFCPNVIILEIEIAQDIGF